MLVQMHFNLFGVCVLDWMWYSSCLKFPKFPWPHCQLDRDRNLPWLSQIIASFLYTRRQIVFVMDITPVPFLQGLTHGRSWHQLALWFMTLQIHCYNTVSNYHRINFSNQPVHLLRAAYFLQRQIQQVGCPCAQPRTCTLCFGLRSS